MRVIDLRVHSEDGESTNTGVFTVGIKGCHQGFLFISVIESNDKTTGVEGRDRN